MILLPWADTPNPHNSKEIPPEMGPVKGPGYLPGVCSSVFFLIIGITSAPYAPVMMSHPTFTGGSMARFAAKMASCYPSDPARCALNDAVFEMAQVGDGWKMVVSGGGKPW